MNLFDACNALFENPKRKMQNGNGAIVEIKDGTLMWAAGNNFLITADKVAVNWTILEPIEPPRPVVFEMKEMPEKCGKCPISIEISHCREVSSESDRPSTCPLKYKDEYIKEATHE